ncbi:MAG: hypothetical protein KJ915_02515 [Candidatus Omnitrophica bacterium]|nr:hypothetical protein [Candidatus Omnitrophota bacterium]
MKGSFEIGEGKPGETFKINLENAGGQATLIKATTLSHVGNNNAVGIDNFVTPAIQKFLDSNRF